MEILIPAYKYIKNKGKPCGYSQTTHFVYTKIKRMASNLLKQLENQMLCAIW